MLNRLLNTISKSDLFKNVVLTNIFISLADTLIIIPYIVYKIKSKIIKKEENEDKDNANKIDSNKTSEQEDEENKLEYIYNENEDIENVPGKLKYVILIGLIFFANYYLFIYTIGVKSNTWTIYIVFTSLFYYLIFKSKLYRHHYLSIGLILIFGIIIDLVQGNFQKDIKEQLPKFFLSLLRVILLSLDYVLIKYTMEKKYVSPYILGLFIGLINLILFIIFAILDHFFFHLNDGYSEYFKNFNTSELLVILGLMSTQLGLYTCLFFIDKNESPCHIFIVFVFGQFGYIFKNLFDENENSKKINGINKSVVIAVVIISLVLILFFSLVFNEIIELRFLGLAYNTKKNIASRAEDEGGDNLLLNNNLDNRSSIEMSDKASISDDPY